MDSNIEICLSFYVKVMGGNYDYFYVEEYEKETKLINANITFIFVKENKFIIFRKKIKSKVIFFIEKNEVATASKIY